MKKYLKILFTFILLSCSGVDKNRSYSEKIVKSISLNDIDSAVKIIEDESFYSEETNKLLKNLEKATIYYLKGNYCQSLKYFEKSKKISDDLYTTSLSKKISSSFDANLDLYYGEKYERSMIRFYLSLISYNIYQQGYCEAYIDENKNKIEKKELDENEKKFYINYARSSIVEWDSFLQGIQKENQGVATYKDDMLAKIWGAFIHNEYGGNDRQISSILYDDANNLLLRNYNMFPTFNNKSQEFSLNFKKLPYISFQELNKKYIDETKYSISLKEYINRNKKNLNNRNIDNVVIMIKNNIISPKIAIKIPVPINFIEDYNLMQFTQNILYDFERPELILEIPQIIQNSNIKSYTAVLTKNNNEYASTNLTLIEPLSDIAKKTLDDEKSAIVAKSIARISAKYIASILMAQKIYDPNNPDASIFLAKLVYTSAVSLINKTSKADIRYWTTLFSNLQLGGMKVKSGEYTLNIYNDNKLIYKKNIKVEDNKTTFIDLNL